MMFYDVEQGEWRCANNQCVGRRFAFDNRSGTWNVTMHQQSPTPQRGTRRRRALTQPTCSRCGAGLVYSDQQALWCCVVCRNFFTPEQAGWPAPQDAPIPVRGPRKRGGGSSRPERVRYERPRSRPEPTYRPRPERSTKKSTGDYVLLAAAIGLIIIIGVMVILGMSGQLG